jgi:hypothetical protein
MAQSMKAKAGNGTIKSGGDKFAHLGHFRNPSVMKSGHNQGLPIPGRAPGNALPSAFAPAGAGVAGRLANPNLGGGAFTPAGPLGGAGIQRTTRAPNLGGAPPLGAGGTTAFKPAKPLGGAGRLRSKVPSMNVEAGGGMKTPKIGGPGMAAVQQVRANANKGGIRGRVKGAGKAMPKMPKL